MSWFYLIIAGLLEVGWAIGMKYSQGFTKLWPSLFVVVTMAGSVAGLALAMRTLPMGSSYAVWTGIGTVGTAILGMILFDESVNVWRISCLLLILSGIVGLKLLGGK